MSGIEVAGLVLGAFPIILNCLDYYQKGFKPLEEWWNFRLHFIEFIDDVRHEMMKYNQNLICLLDPIIADNDRLLSLVNNPNDPFWQDKTFEVHLKERLSNQTDRVFSILQNMHSLMEKLNKLLQIEGGQVPWIGTSDQKPFQWHLQRIRISFSMGKHRTVKKLASSNQKLQEILSFSERIIPISSRRKASDPVARFEEIRQHAYCVHQALKRRWACSQTCRKHEARLQVNAKVDTVVADVTLVTADGELEGAMERVHRTSIRPWNTPPVASLTDISSVQASGIWIEVQHTLSEQETHAKKRLTIQSTKSLFKTGPETPSPKKVTFQEDNDSTTKKVAMSRGTQVAPTSVPVPITYFCSFLKDTGFTKGLICDEFDRQLLVCKARSYHHKSSSITLMSLHDVLKAYSSASLSISRQSRFEIATHIASALLQTHPSPWLAPGWSKHDFYFIVDTASHDLCTTRPFIVHSFPEAASHDGNDPDVGNDSGVPDTNTDPFMGIQGSMDGEARAILRSVGVMLLELIFGLNIEDCPFRKSYYGFDNKPNDQTDINTAGKWAEMVLGECGADIEDVVRRCLYCAFGPKPVWTDIRFRESVYEGVISPLSNYAKTWPLAFEKS
ncbi:hypothetical protein CDV36_014191 [Fusarium kuroshium]|uniref:DUF7580 domain-containing protein n=1 Tax=Fusarium kuroshium TaxID=2010991 RepID=A0A3M2RIG8_9HYPO|nr:hypothetical protein CDV36_014191 [Fusarium kuroshium]